jgi:sec-independent protein translocase protein TatA
MDFFGMGPTELLLVLLVAMIFLGPGKIAELATKLGKAVNSFRKASSEFTTTVNKEMEQFKKASSEITTTVNKEMEQLNIDTRKPTANPPLAVREDSMFPEADSSSAMRQIPTGRTAPARSSDNIDSPGAGI